MVRGALFGSFSSQYAIVLSKKIYFQGLIHVCRRGTDNISQFGLKSWSVDVKLWLIVKWVKKLKTCQTWFWEHFLVLFAGNTRPLQLRTLISKESTTIAEEVQFI